VAISYVHGNKHSDYINNGNFVRQLSAYSRLKKFLFHGVSHQFLQLAVAPLLHIHRCEHK